MVIVFNFNLHRLRLIMKIGIHTWGTRGDIVPFIALARALNADNHQVTLYITLVGQDKFFDPEMDLGFPVTYIGSSTDESSADVKENIKEVVQDNNPLRQFKRIMSKFLVPIEDEVCEAASKLCRDNDLLVGQYLFYPLQIMAEKHNKPYVSVTLAHTSIPSMYLPPTNMPNLGGLSNKFLWWLTRSVLNKNLKPIIDQCRAKHMLAPASDLLTEIWASRLLNLIAVSPVICESKKDWGKQHQVCGYFDVSDSKNGEAGDEIASDLKEFIQSGEPPVFMGFGSWMIDDLEVQRENVNLFVESIKLSRHRAIVQASRWQDLGFKLSERVHFVGNVNHANIFPHCACVVHHGGAGTTQTAIKAGIPSVIVAYIGEQLFWGAELARLGVATKTLTRKTVKPADIASQIDFILGSPKIVKRAKEVGALMKAENGAVVASKLINRQFGHLDHINGGYKC